MKHTALVLLLLVCGMPEVAASSNAQGAYVYKPILNQDYIIPNVLIDPRTKVIYYLESDGRHISAISPDGKLLWHVDPFVDAGLHPYRFSTPIILSFSFPDSKWWGNKNQYGKVEDFIAIGFNSSQFGIMRKSNGTFLFEGQD